ncbi:MAG: hypothetical protein FJ034_05990, partial [Chloroflexi bacterium]|nr:hypothetical protein [Chloroflexota bacterium]
MTAPIVAVIPFGARGGNVRAGAWARQIARRLVDRFAQETAFTLKPLFLVTMPDEAAANGTGYLVFGSTPDDKLAAQYGRGASASHVLSGVYREEDGRTMEVSLVEVDSERSAGSLALPVPEDALPAVEPALGRWLAESLGVAPSTDVASPPAATEAAYAELLEGMDHEVNATLLRAGDAARAGAETAEALAHYLAALGADPACAAAEERLLFVAAEALDRGGADASIRAL